MSNHKYYKFNDNLIYKYIFTGSGEIKQRYRYSLRTNSFHEIESRIKFRDKFEIDKEEFDKVRMLRELNK